MWAERMLSAGCEEHGLYQTEAYRLVCPPKLDGLDTRAIICCGCSQYKSSLKHDDGGLAACGNTVGRCLSNLFLDAPPQRERTNINFALTTSMSCVFGTCIVLPQLVATRLSIYWIAVGLLGCLQGLKLILTLLKCARGWCAVNVLDNHREWLLAIAISEVKYVNHVKTVNFCQEDL
jgi:hypothetical protein